MFKLNKEDSNKILKYFQVILFASCLSMLNPINVEAKENNVENSFDNLDESDKAFLIGLTVESIFGIILYKYCIDEIRKAPKMKKGIKIDISNERQKNKAIRLIYKERGK